MGKRNRLLYRSRRDYIFGGVCAGIADKMNIDPTIIRLIWAIAALGFGFGILLYFLLWLIVPER